MANKKALFLYLFVVAMLLPLLVMRDFMPANELRYLSIADEALREGHLFVFTNHGVPYADKPPLYLWIVMASHWLFGQHLMLILSLFSLVPALVITETMARWSALEDRQAQVLRMVLLSNILFVISALTLRMDMLMTMFIVLASRTFYDAYEQHRRIPLRFGLYLFLGMFTKGPLGLMLPLAFILTFLWWKRDLRHFWHVFDLRTIAIVGGLCALWLTAVYHEGGTAYLYNLVVYQTIGRAFLSFHHRHGLFYYCLLIWPLLIPWLLVIPGALLKSLRHDAHESDVTLFMAAATLSGFAMLSVISSKLSIYLLPLFPFLFTLAVRCFCAPYVSIRTGRVGETLIRVGLVVAGVLYQAGLPALSMLKHEDDLPVDYRGYYIAAAIVLSVFGIIAIVYDGRHHRYRTVRTLFVGLYVAVFVLSLALPGLNTLFGYRTLCEQATQLARQHHVTTFAAVGLKHAAAMDVYLHHPVRVYPAATAADSLPRPAVILYPKGPRYLAR